MEVERRSYTMQSSVELRTLPGHLIPDSSQFAKLYDIHPEDHNTVMVYGKEYKVPRYSQTYIRSYTYSGVTHEALPVPDELLPYYEWANSSPYGPFNSMLVNWYDNGLHYISAHRDNERDMVPYSDIMSISLGADRPLRVKNYKTKKTVDNISQPNGTVLVMRGRFNDEFTHEIPKRTGKSGNCVGRRINITLRKFK